MNTNLKWPHEFFSCNSEKQPDANRLRMAAVSINSGNNCSLELVLLLTALQCSAFGDT